MGWACRGERGGENDLSVLLLSRYLACAATIIHKSVACSDGSYFHDRASHAQKGSDVFSTLPDGMHVGTDEEGYTLSPCNTLAFLQTSRSFRSLPHHVPARPLCNRMWGSLPNNRAGKIKRWHHLRISTISSGKAIMHRVRLLPSSGTCQVLL